MFTESVCFYGLSGLLLGSLVLVIFAPRMFLALISLLFGILFTGLLCWSLNAKFIAVCMFLVFGVVLCPVIWTLMNMISRWNLPLKLVNPAKIIFTVFSLILFIFVTVLFIREEFSSSLLNIFNFVNIKSSEGFNFSEYVFPLHLIVILSIITIIVIKALVFSKDSDAENETERECESAGGQDV